MKKLSDLPTLKQKTQFLTIPAYLSSNTFDRPNCHLYGRVCQQIVVSVNCIIIFQVVNSDK